MNEDTKRTVVLLEKICDASGMTNKWIMWADRTFPEQGSFSFSIYQLRDAFSHMMNMYTYGFVNHFLDADNLESKDDWDGFFSDPDTYHQLKDAFGHVARSFFDCADFIYMLLNSDSLSEESNATFLRQCLNRCSGDVDKLRAAKSEQPEGIYETMKQWDKLLQFFTVAYTLEDSYAFLQKARNRAEAIMDRIEKDYNEELIKLREPNFFEMRTRLEIDWNSILTKLEGSFSNDGELLQEIIDNPAAFADQWQATLVSITKEIDERYAYYEALHTTMEVPGKRNKREKRRSVISKVISMLVTPFASLIAGNIYQHLNQANISVAIGQDAPVVVSISAIYWGLGIFIMGQVIALIVGRGREK